MTSKQPTNRQDQPGPDKRIVSLYRGKALLERQALPKLRRVRAENYARAMLSDGTDPDPG